jgi:aspartate aminotransferase
MLKGTLLAERLSKVNPSSTLAITAKARILKAEGKDIVNLAAGEPDFDTPDFIKAAAIEAIHSGFTKYTPTTGIPELKQLICEKFKKENGLDYQPSQIIVSCGAKHSIYNALMALVNRDEEVLIPMPYWVSYPEMVRLCDGIPCFLKTQAQNSFKIIPKELTRAISDKTKVLILNSPSNPTGCVYSRKELEEIARICVERGINVISDEIYEKLIYDGVRHESIAAINKEIFGLTITVNGLSKSYSMTGWRIGYLGAPAEIAEAVSRLQDHSTSNPTSISQKAGVAALNAPADFSAQIRRQFEQRRDYCASRLKGVPQLSFVMPQGAFYIFVDISKTGLNSQDFAGRLLEECFVSLIPGDSFGADDFVRISFATSLEELGRGFDRIEKWAKQLPKKS